MTDPLREAAQAVVDEYDNEPTYPRRSAYFFTALRPHIDALRAALRSTPAAPRCNCNGENERPRGHVSTCPLWTPNPFATPAAPQPDYQIIDKGGSNMEVRFAKVAHPSPADAPAPQSLRDALVKFVTGEGAMATDPDGDCYFCEAEGVDFELPFHPGADPDHAGEHEDWCLVPIARAALDAPALTTPQSLRDSLIATLEASEQPPVIEGLLDVRRAIDLAGLHESIEVYGDVSVDEMEASCIVLIDNAIDALRAALRSTPAAPQPDPFTAQTIHAAQDRMLRDPGTRWITDDDGHTEKFIPATVALRETNRMRPDSPAYVAPQPDTARTVECPHCDVRHQWPCPTIPRCDAHGCEAEATCGIPTQDGYMRICGKHYAEFSALGKGVDRG